MILIWNGLGLSRHSRCRGRCHAGARDPRVRTRTSGGCRLVAVAFTSLALFGLGWHPQAPAQHPSRTAGGTQCRCKEDHSLYWVPVQYWSAHRRDRQACCGYSRVK